MWMILAIAQSLLWLFGLPIFCRKYWDRLFGFVSPGVADVIIGPITSIIFIFGYNIIMLPIYYMQHPFFEQFKIQRDRPWPWLDKQEKVRRDFWNLIARSVKLTLFNAFIVGPILTVSKTYLLPPHPSMFRTDNESWPNLLQNIRDLCILAILHEFGFYFTHRMMHSYPFLYKYHKVHHEFKMNVALAAQYNHPIDFILSIGGPMLLALALVNPHSSTYFQFLVWSLFANLDDHVGYSFPWSPVRWFPLAAATDEHEFHHSKNLGCFGSKLSIFNLFLGGYEHFNRFYAIDEPKKKQ